MAQRVPQLGYMRYFDEERATKEIEANVSPSFARFGREPDFFFLALDQLSVFVDSIFQSGAASVKNSEWTKVGGLRKILLDGARLDATSRAEETKGGLLNEEVSLGRGLKSPTLEEDSLSPSLSSI